MVLALTAVMAAPMAASAVDTTAVSGTMPALTLSITAPSAITLGSLYGATGDATGTSGTPGTVLSLMNPTGYKLEINSNKTDGKMQETTGKLDTVLRVTADLVTGTGATATQVIADDVTVLDTPLQIVGTTAASSPTETGTNSITLSVAQAKQITGVAGATYTLTLTFTVTANS
jgi:hypothetical protein